MEGPDECVLELPLLVGELVWQEQDLIEIEVRFIFDLLILWFSLNDVIV